MAGPRRSPDVCPQSVEDLMAVFESTTTMPPTDSCSEDRLPPSRRSREGSWLLTHGSESNEIVRERVKIFEEGSYESMPYSAKRRTSLEDLILSDVLTRKSELLECLHRSLHSSGKWDHDRTVSSLAESSQGPVPLTLCTGGRRTSHRRASTGEMPGPSDLADRNEQVHSCSIDHRAESQAADTVTATPRSRPRLERRASTGRVRFVEEPTVWEFTDTFAAKLTLPQTFGETKQKSGSDRAPRAPTRPGCHRRYSTGCVDICKDSEESGRESTGGFWQLYEPNDSPPKLPLRKDFTRRRTVRFHQHVTVFVFSKDVLPEADVTLPRSFVRRPSSRVCVPLRKPRRSKAKRSGEHRFNANNGISTTASPPSMPCRRDTDQGENGQSDIALPQCDGDFGVPVPPLRTDSETTTTSSPQIPKRRPSLQDTPQLPTRRPSLQDEHGPSVTTAASTGSKDPVLPVVHLEDDADSATWLDGNEGASSPGTEHNAETEDKGGCDSERQRRERAITWFRRFAMPTYETMKQLVRETPGLDITLDDVDLLPWDKGEYKRTTGNYRIRTRRVSVA